VRKSRKRLFFEVAITIIILILAIISLRPLTQAHQKTQLDHANSTYVGNVLKAHFGSKNTLKFKNKNRYIGHFKDGRFEGKGQFVSHAGWKLKGTFKNGEPTGKVQLRIDNKTNTHKLPKN